MPGDPFYWSAAWRRFRAGVLADAAGCATPGCTSAPSHVDHITPRAAGGAPFDRANVRPLCPGCHSRKTSAADGGFGNPRRPGARAAAGVAGCDARGRPADPAHPWNRGRRA